ncbi:OB-fold domain-containing protein [Bradyrhizobium elkanii]|uniref:OB-fold domain-containing protein n=1 Tax=Bradyrhizobium elkanii TaxID=29448 RepID=UPI0020127D39
MSDPYVLAYVALWEGPIVLTNIVNVDPANLAIGTIPGACSRPLLWFSVSRAKV